MKTMNQFYVLGGSFFAHYSPDILIKRDVKETVGKFNIRGEFYIPEVESLGGGQII